MSYVYYLKRPSHQIRFAWKLYIWSNMPRMGHVTLYLTKFDPFFNSYLATEIVQEPTRYTYQFCVLHANIGGHRHRS